MQLKSEKFQDQKPAPSAKPEIVEAVLDAGLVL
jgi:hypothetical protein